VNRPDNLRTFFVTGTDTGVGKTLLTALLLTHLRHHGRRVLALKPFCSGGRFDAELLLALQDTDLDLDDINPFYFPEPLAPGVAARKHRRSIKLNDVLAHLESVVARGLCPIEKLKSRIKNHYLLIEGAGGLLVPLGEGFSVLDLICNIASRSVPGGLRHAPGLPKRPARNTAHSALQVIVVSPNRLGTINHTLLTVRTLQHAGIQRIKVVLMEPGKGHLSARSNPKILAQLLAPIPLLRLPFLGPQPARIEALKKKSKKIKKTLALILG
jgi:dethiobiotin synthetase